MAKKASDGAPQVGRVHLARELAERFPDQPTRSLARKLYAEHPECFKDYDAARSVMRFVRGARGKESRDNTRNAHTIQDRKDKPQMELPPSQADAWEPFVIETPCRVLSLSDIHIPFHDEKAVRAAVTYGKRSKPDVVLLNGDVSDFYVLSRFEKHPGKRHLKNEIDTSKEFWQWLRKRFPNARIIYKLGNHDERWDKWIWQKAAELWDIPQCQLHNILGLDDLGIEVIGDQRPVCVSNLVIFHGHELPRGLTSPVNQARGAFLRLGASSLTAHGHTTSQHTEYLWRHGDPDTFKREVSCWSQACLCHLYPEYARINKWNHGAANIEAADDKSFAVENFRISPDYKIRRS